MKKILLVAIAALFVWSCEPDQGSVTDVPGAVLAKKPSKKCVSCGLFLAPVADSLQVVDLSGPSPKVISKVELPQAVYCNAPIIRNGDFVYIYTNPRLSIVDLTNPASPLVTNFALGYYENFCQLELSGTKLYATDALSNYQPIIWVFDVSDAGNPVDEGWIEFPPCPACSEP